VILGGGRTSTDLGGSSNYSFGIAYNPYRLYFEGRCGEDFHPSGAHGWVSRS